VRHLLIICILFSQLLGSFTAEAGKPFKGNVLPQTENAGLYAASLYDEHAAEVARPIQFNYITFRLTAQRLLTGSLSINNLGYYIPDELRKRENVRPAFIGPPLVRLLLFPNHYFW
jgi:hypothetical protein